MTAEATAPPRPRGALGLMFDPVFGALFWGKMFAVVAVWTHGIVAAIVMYDATQSALMVGLVGVVQFGPQLILSPTSGKWADTGNPARQILLGRVLCVAGSGSRGGVALRRPGTAGHVRRDPRTHRIVAGRFRLRRGRPGDAVDRAESDSRGRTLDRHGAQQHADDGRPHRRPRVRCLPGRTPRSAAGFAVSAGLHLVFAIFLLVVASRRRPNVAPEPTTVSAPRSSTSGRTARCCSRWSR